MRYSFFMEIKWNKYVEKWPNKFLNTLEIPNMILLVFRYSYAKYGYQHA